MQITLKQLEIVHAIVIAGSISGSRTVLQLSQPTISQQLAKIEEELGTQLVSRGRAGKLTLTPAADFWNKTAGQLLGLPEWPCSRFSG
ncbi:HTH-type transcriptional regulator CatM (plasmid) [Antarctobacter heliothermus]|uniref:HTH-type transcriptional regulator CatM n=1 Tax=Antarctobacter heliothermus TaxID=74033 RepID=A0A222EBG3_9RHOB|nr:HTH-type transcriptional regulator CatM [Antarctobacter heliothermus]